MSGLDWGMAECAFCKAETELYDGGSPICVHCSNARENRRKPPTSEHRVLGILQEDLHAATERSRAASASFDAVTRDVPSKIPQPDGTQRIHNASREVSLARVDLIRAHSRLSDYIGRGIVPEDLKQSG